MTKRDNLLKALRRQGFEEIPCDMVFTPPKEEEFYEKVKDRTVAEYYDFSHRVIEREYIPGYEGNGFQFFEALHIPDGFKVDEFGIGMSPGSEAAFHMVHFHSPLEGENTSLAQIQDFKLPSLKEGSEEEWTRFAEDCRKEGYAAFGWMEQTIWERAWLIRGMNDLMMDMMMEDERAACILDKVTAHSIEASTAFARAGIDIIAFGDDVGMQKTVMISPDLWRQWLKPRLAEVIAATKAVKPDILVFYHSCGFIEPFIPDLIEIGVDILNPIQPECMDFRKIHDQYGDRISFWGGIGTQTTFPFGSEEEVRQSVRDLVDICGEKGGIVVGPTHVLEPEVPWENQEAMLDEVRTLNRALQGQK
ncbi:MAG: uroporphyrinogen decarboxylase family protein [Spirochaetales bacterium]|nr:uroporphyrinogen decarboxylase family protein [Spirochaetales bacterium]